MRTHAIPTLRSLSLVVALALAAATAPTTLAVEEDDAYEGPNGVHAELDGRPLPLKHVSRYYCHDFDHPRITCSRDPIAAQDSVDEAVAELESEGHDAESFAAEEEQEEAAVSYVTVYDYTMYAGSWMTISSDYDTLFWVGWNDKISSFRGRNYEQGSFYTDWYGMGSSWHFCCNVYQSSLGGFDNSITSVYRR